MRIEFTFEPHFARQVGIREIEDHGAPYPKVDRPLTCCAIAWTTGTDKARESRWANGPSTATNGVRRPAASQPACVPFVIRCVLLHNAPGVRFAKSP